MNQYSEEYINATALDVYYTTQTMKFQINNISFYIPDKIFREEPNEILMLDFIQWNINPRRFTGNTYAAVTKVAELSLYSPTKDNVWFNEFDYPVLYYLPKELKYSSLIPKDPNEPLYQCLNWNNLLKNWVSDLCDFD